MKGRTPTVEEKRWLDSICLLGCIDCQREMGIYSPAEPHHIDGKTKPGAHLNTIPLCPAHHRFGLNDAMGVSRHPHKAEFECMYGTEQEFLEATQRMIGHESTCT